MTIVYHIPQKYAMFIWLVNKEYNLLLLMLSQEGRQDNPAQKYGMNGIMQTLFPEQTKAIDALKDRGYFRKQNIAEVIASATIKEMCSLLSEIGVPYKKSEKREVLLDKVMESLDHPSVVKYANDNKTFAFSEKGFIMAKSLYEERRSVEIKVFNNLLSRNMDNAIKIWTEYTYRQMYKYFPEAGIPKSLRTVKYGNYAGAEQGAYQAALELYGGPPMFYPDIIPSSEASYETLKVYTRSTIEDLTQSSISMYRFNCVCDSSTCKTCAGMDGKTYKISDADIGVNCTPMHEGCRCFISPYFKGKESSTRFARNPLTDVATNTNAKTYMAWEKSLSEEELTALKKKRMW